MSRARLAHVDYPVQRHVLADPEARKGLRIVMYRMLVKMGRVDDSTVKFVRDPPDGPLVEQGALEDTMCIVRISAMVVPHDA